MQRKNKQVKGVSLSGRFVVFKFSFHNISVSRFFFVLAQSYLYQFLYKYIHLHTFVCFVNIKRLLLPDILKLLMGVVSAGGVEKKT